MARSLHVRLDDASAAALDVVRAEGLNDSQAVRTALHEAAQRRRSLAAVRAEVRALAEDPADVEQMRAIREQMAESRLDRMEVGNAATRRRRSDGTMAHNERQGRIGTLRVSA